MEDGFLEYKVWIVLAAFIALFAAERSFPAVKYSTGAIVRLFKNMSFWPLNIGLSVFIVLPVSYFAANHALWDRPEWLLGISGLLFDIILLDLFLFWWHRFVHENQFLWRFHEVHHLDEHLDTSSAIRFHFGEVFFSAFVRAIVIVLFAVPIVSVIIFEMLVLIFTLFHHSNIALPQRFESRLSKIIITPSIHWVHHHARRADTDSNYGTIFSFWDPLFKTKSKTRRTKNMKIGVEHMSDRPLLDLLKKPFK